MAASRNIFDALLDSYNRIQNYCDDVWKNGLIGTFVNRCFIILFRKELQFNCSRVVNDSIRYYLIIICFDVR